MVSKEERSAGGLTLLADAERAAVALEPTRLGILRALRAADSAAGVARRLGLPRQRVNYHVRTLEEAGLLEEVGRRKVRNCEERLVRATARHFVLDPGLLDLGPDDPAAAADRFSSSYLIGLAARVVHEVAHQAEGAAAAGQRLPTLAVETEVRFAGPTERKAFVEELTTAVMDLVAKYHDEEAEEGRSYRLMVGSHPAPSHAPDGVEEAR